MNKNTHFLSADILRGVAITMVIVFHSFGWMVPWKGWFRDFAVAPRHMGFIGYPITLGWAGVALFFVLSGFCIHMSFLRSPAFSIRRFVWHRFWRIVPAYFVSLAFCTAAAVFFFHKEVTWWQFSSHVLFIHNLFDSTFFGINPPFWSIATEAQLYLLFPILLVIRRRIGIAGCLWVTFLVALVWRVVAISVWGFRGFVASAFSSPLMPWFDWTQGMYVAERVSQSRTAVTRHALWLALAVPACLASSLYKPLAGFTFSLAAVSSAVLLDWLLTFDLRDSVTVSVLARPILFVGGISYSLYLWHMPLLMLRGTFGHRLNPA